MADHITPTMRKALSALVEHSGEGAIDRHGVVVAAGERLRFDSITWLRMATLGLVEPAGPLRLRLTAAGRAAAGGEAFSVLSGGRGRR